MKTFQSAGMAYNGNSFLVLDQTQLPHREQWVECSETEILIDMIKNLAIRGAPAIGISATILLGLLAERGLPQNKLADEAQKLISARPTAVNLKNNVEYLLRYLNNDYPREVVAAAERILAEDKELCEKIAQNGVGLFSARDKILTHCHTGAVATAGCGTALGIIGSAHLEYGDIFVWIDETRPLLQGARLTAWECVKLKIPHKIICDNMAAMLMQKGKVDHVLVGSDRIATNGDFANKIGTYSLAVLAHYHGIPFHVAAPSTTVDTQCSRGDEIPIEERESKEVKGTTGSFGIVEWAPTQSSAYNPAFDVTPAKLVTTWILDSGVYTQKDVKTPNWWV